MTTYIALFRGINMGGHHRITMKELSRLLEALGSRNVRTYIQSGNVVFQSNRQNRDKLAKDIRSSILTNLGFAPEVVLLTESELRSAITGNPFDTHNGKTVHVFFMNEQPVSPDIGRLTSVKSATEQFSLTDRVFYLYTPDGVASSKLVANIEKCLAVPVTGRNWNTVTKLASMLDVR